ncbi:MAG: SCO family protein [Bacteroidetes bacterium]|nr:MAG: SCO family protein [Bacteroidota bacterium]
MSISKKTFYILFFSGLIVAFYFIITSLVPEFKRSKLTPISRAKPFFFTNQEGKQVTEKDVAGKVFVASYFFTTCRGICPEMNGNLKKVYERFKGEKDFLILSHTSDPEVDSVPRIKRYADSIGADPANWIFLTGRKDSLYNMARFAYAVDDPANNLKSIDDDFLHTQFWALVNKRGEVFKIYDGLKMDEVNSLIRDIEKTLKD